MEVVFGIFDGLDPAVQDIIWVGIIFCVIAVFSFLVAFLIDKFSFPQGKEGEVDNVVIDAAQTVEPEIKEHAPEQVREIREIDEQESFQASEPAVTAEQGLEYNKFKTKPVESQPIEQTGQAPAPPSDTTEDISTGFQVPELAEEVEVEEYEESETATQEESAESLFSRLRSGLSKTQTGFLGKLDQIFSSREVDEDMWGEFEETLIMSDIGVNTTMELRERIEERLDKKSFKDTMQIREALREEVLNMLKSAEGRPISIDSKPTVIMIAGVNGVGKTTSIGKLANKFKNDKKRVMVAAADTFRAAAVEQLEIWASRVGSEFLKGDEGADPSSVAFDAVKSSIHNNIDVLIVDTAGRLHTKSNLMDELKKIKRVIGKEMVNAPHETLIVLDATTGQNAVQQAKMFKESIDISGIILTKLDGTAKGGVIIAIANELNIPVKYIGIGESLSDLREFKAEEFVEALFFKEDQTVH